MVKSTIDDIKDITLERQIRKLAGVIDKQNEVISGVGDVNTRLTAVEDSTANNTVQINSVKVDVAKNTTAIENISNRVTNVEQSTEAIPGIQTEIDGINKSLVSGVTASFDNPSRTLQISVERQASPSIDATVVIPASSETGQYSEGNGIKIQNYQISVDTAVVALKSDIPVIPDVTELTQRVTTLETEMPTKASVESVNTLETTVNSNTQNITTLTESVNGKVAIAQGAENAGKVLGIGADGNVTPVNAGGSSGGGEVWEEVDLSNFPTDWVAGDRVKISAKYLNPTASSTNWNGSIDNGSPGFSNAGTPIVEFIIDDSGFYTWAPVYFFYDGTNAVVSVYTVKLNTNISAWNGSNPIMYLELTTFNGNTISRPKSIQITGSAAKLYIYKMWRCRVSQ